MIMLSILHPTMCSQLKKRVLINYYSSSIDSLFLFFSNYSEDRNECMSVVLQGVLQWTVSFSSGTFRH